LLFRVQLLVGRRAPVASIGGIALLGYGILAAVASVASAGSLAQPGFLFHFGTPYSDEIALDQPIDAGQTFTVNNANGRTVIHGGSGSGVPVIARLHRRDQAHPPARPA